MVDTTDLKSVAVTGVRVQLPPWVPLIKIMKYFIILLFLATLSFGQRNRHVALEWNSDADRISPSLSSFVASGWYNSPWLGAYYQHEEWWIYHCEKGWLYPENTSDQGVWFYWVDINRWVWTHEDVYPWGWDGKYEAWFNFCIKSDEVLVYYKAKKVTAPN